MKFLGGVIVGLLVANAAFAAPDRSLRPVSRMLGEAPQKAYVLRPEMRPSNTPVLTAITAVTAPAVMAPEVTEQAVARALRPNQRTKSLVKKAMAKKQARKKGAVCGDVDIQGEFVGFVPGRFKACGIQDAVKVRSISGVGLSQQALMNCRTAKALKKWVNKGMKPAVGKAGGGVKEIRVAAHYACRTRNNQPGAKISEHGKGNAIDISAFRLNDGSLITVLGGWRTQHQGPILKKMHKSACGPFGTVLGPNSDRFHQDHFHFDTAKYRSGSYCK
ncbi:Extensin-like protein C-terminus [Thalassococcus halodurans]|uniref:Extensin-like protein C-terminus n=1 Tax=Thalassococcus halodurans TaxID=373675 RepID=A0A1H5Z0I8_9RHOB|nr:extensin family protein [Thalassococcus halodurans]SEG29758.1 Extensin-like protein C-terminus [Thalassococcus halodurans]